MSQDEWRPQHDRPTPDREPDVVFDWRPSAEANPYAPPQTAGAAYDPGVTLTLASRGERLAGAMIDGLAWGVAAVLFAVDTIGPVLGLAAIAAVVIANIRLLDQHGQSIGKRLVGTHIVRIDGSRASVARLMLLRSGLIGMLSLIPILGNLLQLVDALMIFGEQRRCLHDHIADTKVLRGTPPARATLATAPPHA